MNEDKLKTYFWILLDLFVAGAVINLVFFVMPAIKEYKDSLTPAKIMTVSAEGKTIASPDIAEFSFSVITQGPNPEKISSDNNEKMSKAIEKVKSQGIDAKDIKTTNYQLSPNYSYDKNTGKSYIYGYTLTQTVLVKIRDLQKAATVVSSLPALRINETSGISFKVDEPEKFLAEARSEAIKKAEVKAAEMARGAGVKLGRVVGVSEYQTTPVPFVNERSIALGFGGAAAPTIEPGTQEIKVQVSLTYSLE